MPRLLLLEGEGSCNTWLKSPMGDPSLAWACDFGGLLEECPSVAGVQAHIYCMFVAMPKWWYAKLGRLGLD